MTRLSLILFCFLSFNYSYGQIDYSKLIVGRTTGTKLLHDGNSTRIFGFAETLGAPIDIPGPTIIINEGDSVEIDFWNMSQGAPHTIHLHGLDVDQQNDGVPHLSFEVEHMGHGFYYFKAPAAGTYIYHCHVVSTIHVQAGMYGVIIVRPPNGDPNITWENGEVYDREFLWTATEIDTNWHTDMVLDHPYDTVNPQPIMIPEDFNPQYYLINGQSGSQLSDVNNFYTAAENDKVYMRLVNIGYQGVRYIFPTTVGARSVSSDGRPLPVEYINDTVTVLPGERYGSMIQLGTDPLYPVTVEHFNLNTQTVESSQTVTIRTSSVGIEEINEYDFIVYPNPSEDGVYNFEGDITENYTIYDMLGNSILSDNQQIVDLSKEARGIYTLRYKNKSKLLIKL